MRKKTVGLDARMWDHPGIGRYIRELSRELVGLAKGMDISFIGNPKSIRDFFTTAKNSNGVPSCIDAHSKIYSLAEQWEIPQKTSSLDLLHVPHFNIPVFLKKKLVVTIHDLIYFHQPDASRSKFGKTYMTWLLKVIEKKASGVITVSEYTKRDLLNYFPGLSAERVFVTYEAPSPLFKQIEDPLVLQPVKDRYGLSKPFVLFVGTLKPHKNLPVVVNALKILRDSKGIEHELVLVGRKDPQHQTLLNLVARNPFVRHLGECADSDLRALYNLADVFVLPSYFEGFGLPVVEAMACGTPVISSDRSSLPEVVGSAGALFNPDKVDALSDLLYNILTNQELRKNMSKMGLEQVKKFSWRRTAEQTLKVYEKILVNEG